MALQSSLISVLMAGSYFKQRRTVKNSLSTSYVTVQTYQRRLPICSVEIPNDTLIKDFLSTKMMMGNKPLPFSNPRLHLNFVLPGNSNQFPNGRKITKYNSSASFIKKFWLPCRRHIENGENFLLVQIAQQLRFAQGERPQYVNIRHETIFFISLTHNWPFVS